MGTVDNASDAAAKLAKRSSTPPEKESPKMMPPRRASTIDASTPPKISSPRALAPAPGRMPRPNELPDLPPGAAPPATRLPRIPPQTSLTSDLAEALPSVRGEETQRARPSHAASRLDDVEMSGDVERALRASIAEETLDVLKKGQYRLKDGTTFDITKANQCIGQGTRYYPEKHAALSKWLHRRTPENFDVTASVSFNERTTLSAAREWGAKPNSKVGVLNFASATRRGGGFLAGAQAQEESLARASNLYYSLVQDTASPFYQTHIADPDHGFYSSGIIYSPDVTLFRDDEEHFTPPLFVDMLTSAAVNAGNLRRVTHSWYHKKLRVEIEKRMVDRMGRILRLFEEKGAKVLILGSFGTGVFQNSVSMVASIWARLLGYGGRFNESFEHVEFAIIGSATFKEFEEAYNQTLAQMISHGQNRKKGALGWIRNAGEPRT